MASPSKKTANKIATKKPKTVHPLAVAIKLRGAASKKVEKARKALVKAEAMLAKIDDKIAKIEAKLAAKSAKEAANL